MEEQKSLLECSPPGTECLELTQKTEPEGSFSQLKHEITIEPASVDLPGTGREPVDVHLSGVRSPNILKEQNRFVADEARGGKEHDADQEKELGSRQHSICDPSMNILCPICWEDMGSKRTGVTRLKCDHRFHKSCLDRWKKASTKRRCPLCRGEIPPSPMERLRGFVGRCFWGVVGCCSFGRYLRGLCGRACFWLIASEKVVLIFACVCLIAFVLPFSIVLLLERIFGYDFSTGAPGNDEAEWNVTLPSA